MILSCTKLINIELSVGKINFLSEAQKMKLDLSNILTKVINTHGNIISIDQNQYFNDYKIQIIQKLSNIAHEFGMNNLNPIAEKALKNVIEMNIKSKIKSFISSI